MKIPAVLAFTRFGLSGRESGKPKEWREYRIIFWVSILRSPIAPSALNVALDNEMRMIATVSLTNVFMALCFLQK